MDDEKSTELDARVFDNVLLQGGAEARKELGRQIAALLRDPNATAGEREAVVPTLLKLAGDPVFEVRHHLAQQICGLNPFPADIFFTIVADDDAIALPFLAAAAALDTPRKLAVLKVGDVARRAQIAQRPDITAQCVELILADAEWPVAAALLDNAAYALSGDDYRRLFGRFADQPEITVRLLGRDDLPLEIRILEARRTANRVHRMRQWRGTDNRA